MSRYLTNGGRKMDERVGHKGRKRRRSGIGRRRRVSVKSSRELLRRKKLSFGRDKNYIFFHPDGGCGAPRTGKTPVP